ncbi:MAG: histidine ammonia-lyase [Segetibacter sp.]|nr:histidine ammonia-lyase [Segetibacter sp.]
MSYNYLPLDRKWLNFQQVKNLLDFNQLVSITFDAHERILKCHQYLQDHPEWEISFPDRIIVASDQPGEGLIDNILQNTESVVSEEVPVGIVKLMLMLKIKSLSYGHSGVDIETVKRLMKMYNEEVYPFVDTQGSPGANTDAALHQLCLTLKGMGEVNYKGQRRSSAEVLEELDWKPLDLKRHEELAIASGTEFISACGLYALKKTEQLLKFADVIAALSLDAFDGHAEPFYENTQSLRRHKGQAATASLITTYLQGSEITKREKDAASDPNSFRCIPPVHGASKDAYEYVLAVFLNEINSVTSNPTIFPDDDLIAGSGNFHAQPLALALDFLAICVSEIANISEKRISQLERSVENMDLQQEFNLSDYDADGIINENKQLCSPASVNNIFINNQEDHVSMAGHAAIKCLRVIDNVEKVLAIELLSAAQAIEYRKPLKTSPFLEQILHDFSAQTSLNNHVDVFGDVLKKAVSFVASYRL